jgi:ABC-type nitrate/sulfonate/bicarbonate transport system substrate-binding protein
MTSVRVSYTAGAGFGVNWPGLCAREKGFYRAEGLDVELVPLDQDAQTQGLLSGELPIERRGPDEDIVRIANGAPLRIVMGLARKPPITLYAQPEIRSIEQLRGKTLAGVSSKYGSTLALRMALTDAGLADGEYAVIPSGGTLARYRALQSGEVAATLLSPPTTAQALAAGFVPLAKLSELYPNFLYSSIQVNTAFAHEHPETVIALLRADIRAQQWIAEVANRAEAEGLIAAADGMSATDASACYDEIVGEGVLCRSGEIGPAFLYDLISGLRRLGDVGPELRAEECLDLQYVEAARNQLTLPPWT